ncbi:MAG: AMP-binding protein, partial [Gammaproteobacteria bacterium]
QLQSIFSTTFPKEYLMSEENLIPLWTPTEEQIKKTNIYQALLDLKLSSYKTFHAWSVENFEKFWNYAIKKILIAFKEPYNQICDLSSGLTKPNWLPGAKLNISDSCLQAAPNKTAIIYQNETATIQTITYRQLNTLSNRVANALIEHGFNQGDTIAIAMPMNIESIAIYLGIVKTGCVVVSIADSFSPKEIEQRIKITHSKAIFTQDYIFRNNKSLPLFEKIVDANAPNAIVLSTNNHSSIRLRKIDSYWQDFISNKENFTSVACNPASHMNILFSSGTTGEPKAIVWSHTTPIKCAVDAYFHQDVHHHDILCWPTNLGWMMGPWLIFASLINQTTMALYDGSPMTKSFGKFIQNNKITILGLVPSMVSAWRTSQCMENLNWDAIRLFSSSGECSNANDMAYLMSLAHHKPVIEYCGGTEIGGAYITSTLLEPNVPATFTTPALGLDFLLLDENGNISDNGEVAIIPPSIGLSNELINRSHESVYYEGMPKGPEGKPLRRHGDHVQKINDQYYRALGRIDDTMNLSGIKTSAAEIERVALQIPEISEVAAIAVPPPQGGPSLLVLYIVLKPDCRIEKACLQEILQKKIGQYLNPLFKIHDIVLTGILPRTASNKVMRRLLRDKYNI